MYRTKSESTKSNVKFVNEQFFSKWTVDTAYILGFFTADGCMTRSQKKNSYYIEFVSTDHDVLEKIQFSMKAKQKISQKKQNKGAEGKIAYRIQIGSKKIFLDLKRIGFSTAKSNSVRLPHIPNSFFADFLRGYFDGDGCISRGKYYPRNRNKARNYLSVRFTSGSHTFLQEIRQRIVLIIKTNNGSLIAKQNSGYELMFSTLDSIKILRYIYQRENCLCMERKQREAQSILFYSGVVA